MKIIEEREAWIHTHFVVDSFYISPQEQRLVSKYIEPKLRQMGIQYGLHYKNAASAHRAIIVLECIPFDHIKIAVRQLIDETISEFPSRKRKKRNVVTRVTVEPPESSQENPQIGECV